VKVHFSFQVQVQVVSVQFLSHFDPFIGTAGMLAIFYLFRNLENRIMSCFLNLYACESYLVQYADGHILLSRELLLNLVKNVPVYNYVVTSDIFFYNVSIVAAPCHTFIFRILVTKNGFSCSFSVIFEF